MPKSTLFNHGPREIPNQPPSLSGRMMWLSLTLAFLPTLVWMRYLHTPHTSAINPPAAKPPTGP